MNQIKLLNIQPFQQKLGYGYCGPAVLKMVLQYYGIEKTQDELAKLAGTTPDLGTNAEALQRIFEQFGLKVKVKTASTFEDIEEWLQKDVPVIVDWFTRGRSDYLDSEVPDGHYSIVVGLDVDYIYLQDPEIGALRKLKRTDFLRVWFDFTKAHITSWDDMVIRQLMAVYR